MTSVLLLKAPKKPKMHTCQHLAHMNNQLVNAVVVLLYISDLIAHWGPHKNYHILRPQELFSIKMA